MRVFHPVLIATVVLAGCADYAPAPVSVASIGADFDRRRLDDPGLLRFVAKVTGPTTDCRDVTQLSLAAWWYNPELKVARAQWLAARAAIITAGGRPNPTLTVLPGYGFSPSSGASPWMPLAGVDIPIETAGKRDYRIETAERLADVARCNLADVAWRIHFAVRTRHEALGAVRRCKSILRERLHAEERLLAMQTQRMENGVLSLADLYPFKSAVQRTRTDIADAESTELTNMTALAEAVCVPVAEIRRIGTGDGSVVDGTTSPTPGEKESVDAALTGRGDVLAQISDYAACEAALHLEIAKQYPDIHLASTYQWDQGQSKWQLGLVMEIPLWNRNAGPIAEAEAKRAVSAARLETLQSHVVATVIGARSALKLAGQRLESARAEVALRHDTLKSGLAQRDAGVAEPVDVAAMRVDVCAAELLALDASVARAAAAAAFDDAVQRRTMAAPSDDRPLWENPYEEKDAPGARNCGDPIAAAPDGDGRSVSHAPVPR